MARNNNGFTLLEVLIAVVLLGILSAALYGSYFGVMRARDRASSGMESRRELGATLDLIRREVSSAMFKTNSANELHPLKFVVEDRDNFGAPASTLTLTTLAPPTSGLTHGESGILIVTYRVVEKDKKLSLRRQERDLFSEESIVIDFPQMEQISSFLVECYDGSKWVKSYDSALYNSLPKNVAGGGGSVRVTVQFVEEGKPVEFTMLSTPRIGL
ncbi:MAG: prepilin-type N-terminal cleavage/methylation domain-containing protein [Steroidobacteraceae bacterium]|nr:prepilin-type N-terminal cleavage/methylation domain-containing protein [Deltaproteobacteria bacterium]